VPVPIAIKAIMIRLSDMTPYSGVDLTHTCVIIIGGRGERFDEVCEVG